MGTVTSKIDNCLLFACARDDGGDGGEDEYSFGTEGVFSLPSRTTSLHDGGLDDQLGAVPMIGSLQEEIERIELEASARSDSLPPSPAYSSQGGALLPDSAAPSTDAGSRQSGKSFPPTFVLPLREIAWGTDKCVGAAESPSRPATPTAEESISPGDITRRESELFDLEVVHDAEEHEAEGLKSFFDSDGDDFVNDLNWFSKRRGPSLAELLGRVERLGNVDVALDEVLRQQNEEDRKEAVIRSKVLKRFMDVMGPESPGLAVRKCQRSGRGTRSVGIGGPEHGKWTARTIHYQPAGAKALPDGTPLGGTLVWNSKRRFVREKPRVNVEDITKVENSGKFVWIKSDGESKLGFETVGSTEAKFLCRSIDFLVSAAVRQA